MPFLRQLRIVGTRGALLWGYHEAAILGSWTIRKTGKPGQYVWTLAATLTRVEAFQIRQRPLLFSAPRFGGGMWAWGVDAVDVGATRIVARLGPPEQ
jgi:hypothetical protein